jgi:hypothetical protein
MPSLHPPDVVVKRFSGEDNDQEGFADDDSFGVHSNLTEEKKWADDANEVESFVSPLAMSNAPIDVGPETKEAKSMPVISQITDELDDKCSDSPGDDNEKSNASSGNEILADLARLKDDDAGQGSPSAPRRAFRGVGRERLEIESSTERIPTSAQSGPDLWESFDLAGFDSFVEPRDLFATRSKKDGSDCVVKQDSWEDFNSSSDGPSFFWPKQKATLVAEGTDQNPPDLSLAAEPQEYLQLSIDDRTSVQSDMLAELPKPHVSPELQTTVENDCHIDHEPSLPKHQHRLSIVERFRSSSVSRSKSSTVMSSPRKGWLRRRPRQARDDDVDLSLPLSFDANLHSECDASLVTLDDAPTRALLRSKPSPTSVTRDTRLL